ncbi:MAG: hypothetical protein RID53_14850 [Coleofasciculus sp. B1-GNL1-01]|uniref:hypothetical protein n=1 Tax=Coleofasciculus sp. B1-GNL1-01 TaxID=3068484 RepID=UPI0032FC459F
MDIERLRQLCSLQSLEVTQDIDEVLHRLRNPLAEYAELELRSDGKHVDLITLSEDPNAVDEFLAILKDRGTPEADCAIMIALANFGAGCVVGMKLPIAGSVSGGEMYIRGAIPLSEVEYFLAQRGVGSEAIAQISGLAQIFDKDYTHILAADATSPPSFSVFFTTYLVPGEEERDRDRLQQALEKTGVTEDGIEKFLPLHRLLGASRPETLYFSWRIKDGKPTIGAKIDYAGVRLGLVSEMLTGIGVANQARLPIKWGTQLNVRQANYAGLVIGSHQPSGVRAYFTIPSTTH